jgi:hypothetical protein
MADVINFVDRAAISQCCDHDEPVKSSEPKQQRYRNKRTRNTKGPVGQDAVAETADGDR